MAIATTLSAAVLSAAAISDDRFFEATELLSTRFDRHNRVGEHGLFEQLAGDLRSDEEAPKIIHDWFRHASARVPDFRVWALASRIEAFLDPSNGIPFPQHWPWHTRDSLSRLSAELRANLAWAPAFETAIAETNDAFRQWLGCSGFER